MISRSILGALWLMLAAGLFVAGCSSLQDPAAGVASDAAPGAHPAQASPVAGASRSAYVRAQRGGTVGAGDFQVVIPPGALKGDAIITVRQADLSKPEVELTVTPEERNDFLLPVQLVANVASLDRAAAATSYMSWWDPAAARWTRCPGPTAGAPDLAVRATLRHCSKYRVETGGGTHL